ncbi:MAG: ABC transporter permease [Thermonemataceae bacterium]|nr:ABC transporter permease [Thermonemataceae bacterium]
MDKIWLIIQREYWVRVRKKSFIIMTLLTPILFAALMVIPAIIAATSVFSEEKTILVADKNHIFENKIQEKHKVKFQYISLDSSEALKKFKSKKEYYALLIVPQINISENQSLKLIAKKNISIEIEGHIEGELERIVAEERMKNLGINAKDVEKTKAKIDLLTENEEGKENNSFVIYIVSFLGAILIYMSVLLYGVQVMRSVIEEKTNRIVEVMISSVKPIQLMLGKIIGVAAVGFTQFLLWIVLSFSISAGVSAVIGTEKLASVQQTQTMQQQDVKKVLKKPSSKLANATETLSNLNIPLILGAFLFYFVGGYLLYSAMFAAVGSAGDSETDAQQFTLPISLPLIIGFVIAQSVINDPNSPLAFWASLIPFTSPIVMMVRVVAGVPTWELLLSMFLLVAGFLVITWLAARIYRVGILMFGKKVNFKEIAKWMLKG